MTIEESYDIWSEKYDTAENKTRDLDRKATREMLSKYYFSKVLELGCGTGKNTEWLIDRAESVIALDFSQGMLDQAAKKIQNPKVTFRKTDLTQDWNIPNCSVDLITCSLTLEHIENLDSICEQAYRTLKTGGKFFISELHPYKQYSGTKARYESPDGVVELDVHIHHLSDYLSAAKENGFIVLELREWFDEAEVHIPRLITLVFEKENHR